MASKVKNRRSLTPSTGASACDVHATRRSWARHEVSARVTVKPPSGEVLEGWALNLSRGGVRVILETKVELGAELEVSVFMSVSPPSPQVGLVVWVQDEPDGVVCGIAFRTPTDVLSVSTA
ncbi:MAG: PilZ domain-containing protein [Myxococcota bacterium]|nr:PilZ domain-containing protein [Myxococcota bacterium]